MASSGTNDAALMYRGVVVHPVLMTEIESYSLAPLVVGPHERLLRQTPIHAHASSTPNMHVEFHRSSGSNANGDEEIKRVEDPMHA